MSTLSTKYIPHATLEKLQQEKERETRFVPIHEEATFDRDRIKDSNFNVGINELLPENTTTMYRETFPFIEGNAQLRRQQQEVQRARSKDLRQHSFRFGSDEPKIVSFQQTDFQAHDPNQYTQNKKDIRSIGAVQFPNNWFRADRDMETTWASETRSQFVKKPVTDPVVLKTTRDATKLRNISQKFQYGYNDEPALRQTSSYTDTCNATNQNIDVVERQQRAQQIQAQKRVLSNSSIIHGDPKADSLHKCISSYAEDLGRCNEYGSILSPKERAEQRATNVRMKEQIQKTSVSFGSDPVRYSSEYKGTFREVKFQ